MKKGTGHSNGNSMSCEPDSEITSTGQDAAHLYPPHVPFPVKDTLRYTIDLAMLLKSWECRRYAKNQQFGTVRRLMTGFSTVCVASIKGVSNLKTIGGERAKHHLND